MAEHTHYRSLFQVGGHHLAQEFVKLGHDVFYISSPISPLHAINFIGKKRTETKKKFTNWLSNGEQINKNLYTYVPFSFFPIIKNILFDNVLIRNLSLKYTYPSIINKIKKNGPYDILLVSNPLFVFLKKHIKFNQDIFRITDFVTEFDNAPKTIKFFFEYGINNYGKIIVTAQTIKEKITQTTNKPIYYAPNGVDFPHFCKTTSEPSDLQDIPHPRLIYVGAIEKWFDIELVDYLSREIPKINIIIIGPPQINIKQIEHKDNVHIFGPKEYASIPSYIKHCDVGIIPFIRNSLIDGVSPIKMYEYMSCGLPVVSTEWSELKKINSPTLLSKDKYEFKNNIIKIISNKIDKNIFIEYAKKNSWESRAKQIIELCNK